MKLLMVGELASAGFFLAKGFNALGIEVHHLAHSHSWRKDPVASNLSSSSRFRIVRGLHRYINPLLLDNISGYDAVLFLDYWPFQSTRMVNKITTRKIQENNGPSYFWSLGCDSKVREWSKLNNFTICNSCLLHDQKSTVCQTEKNAKDEEIFLSGIKNIIPSCYEYYEGHKTNSKTTTPIQMAISCEQHNALSSGNKIKFLHGLNRFGFKGTQIVENVFRSMGLARKEAEFLISDRLPLTEWIHLLLNQDVVVDQLYNKSLGMNSLFILGSGKLLIAGDVSPAASIFNIPKPPMISTEPSIEGLTRAINSVLDNYQSIKNYRENAIQYVKDYHSPLVVAEKFIKVFGW